MAGLRDDIETLTPGLRRYARALTPQAGDFADDLVRETLQRALRAERLWRSGCLKLHVYSVLTALNRQRTAAARGDDVGAAAPSRAYGGQGGRPALARPQGVRDALEALPSEERETLLLVALEGFTYAAAAEILGVTRPVVIARLARARQALAERLDLGAPRGRGRPPHLRVVE